MKITFWLCIFYLYPHGFMRMSSLVAHWKLTRKMVPLRFCIVGTHLMHNLIPHPTFYYICDFDKPIKR